MLMQMNVHIVLNRLNNLVVSKKKLPPPKQILTLKKGQFLTFLSIILLIF